MFPHERSLVAKFQNRPFVLLGVNGDQEREQAVASAARHQLNFRSFWCEGGPSSAVVRQFGVQFWPTVFVLDGRGVIRYAGPPDLNTVDRIIEDLLREIEARRS